MLNRDQELILRCQGGDQAAFADLFERYKNLVFKTAFLLLGAREEADDALQEVFLQVYRSLPSYDPGRWAFTTWLHRVTVNHCLNRRRRKRPVLVPLEQDREAAQEAETAQEAEPDEAEALKGALLQLSGKLRAVIVLRYYWEQSYAEIAQTLGIPIGTVKSRLDLAVRTLRREVGALSQELLNDPEVVE